LINFFEMGRKIEATLAILINAVAIVSAESQSEESRGNAMCFLT
jgi:hypothetical protein